MLLGLNLAGLLQYKTTFKVHPTVNMLPGLDLAGPLQCKTTLTAHATVNEKFIIETSDEERALSTVRFKILQKRRLSHSEGSGS